MPNLNPYNMIGSGWIFITIYYYDFGWDFCRVIWILSLNKTDSPRSQTPGRFTRRRFRRRGGWLTGAGYQTAGSHVLADFFFLPGRSNTARQKKKTIQWAILTYRVGWAWWSCCTLCLCRAGWWLVHTWRCAHVSRRVARSEAQHVAGLVPPPWDQLLKL